MICEDVQKYDFTYLDGEFDRRERAEFEAHITACAPCRCHVENSARFRDGLRRHLRCEPAPSHLQARICASLDASERGDALPRWVMPVAMAAGLSLAVVGWQWNLTLEPGESASMIGGVVDVASNGAVAVGAKAQLAVKAAPLRVAVAHKSGGTHRLVVSNGARRVAAIRGSDPKRTAAALQHTVGQRGIGQRGIGQRGIGQHGPALRVTRLLRNNVEFCESDRSAAPSLKLVDHIENTEVVSGGVGDDFLAENHKYGAIRTRANLRALVGSHMQPVPPEVAGSARVQEWLRRAAPGHSSLPIAEGAGVRLLGARLGHLGSRRVVTFRYVAFDKPVTVVRYLPTSGRGLFDDRPEPRDERPVQQSGAVRDMIAGYSVIHTVKSGETLSVVSELEYRALIGIIAPPSFL